MNSPNQATGLSKGRIWPLVLVFLSLTLVIVVTGILAYRTQASAVKTEALHNLEAVTRLKADAISLWLEERQANLRSAANNPATGALLTAWQKTGNSNAREQLLDFLRNFRESYGFASAELLDTSGHHLLGAGEAMPEMAELHEAAQEVLRTGRPVLLDLHRHEADKTLHLGQLVPVFWKQAGERRVQALLFMGLRPETFLYPLIQAWPLPSESAEFVLVRREGEQVLFLSELRHQPDAAFNLRLPLATPDLPAAVSIRAGAPVTIEGTDYRGVRTLGAGRPVPGTPWTLVAKVDEAEALAELDRLGWMVGGLVGLALTATAVILGILVHRKHLRATGADPIAAQRLSRHKYRAGATNAALALAVGIQVCFLIETTLVADARQAARGAAAHMAGQIEWQLLQNLGATQTLAALVKQGRGDISDFDTVARELLPAYRGVSALQLAPAGVIRKIVPLTGNEKAIGYDLLADPHRNREAHTAVKTGELTLVGPVPLTQGGEAMIGRQPVFLNGPRGEKHFWGFTIALIRMADFLGTVWLDRLEQFGYTFELGRQHPDTGQPHIFAHSALPLTHAPERVALEILNAQWYLDVAPARGWHPRERLAVEAFAAMLLALLVGGVTASLTGSRQVMEETDRKYRLLVTTAQEGIWHIDADHRTVYANDTMACLLGYERGDKLLGLTLEHFIFPEDMPAHRQEMASRRHGERGLYERRLKRRDGSECWCLLSTSPLEDSQGHFTGSIALVTDYNERKRDEARLRESETRYRSVVDSIKEVIFQTDARGLWTLLNPAWMEITGFPVETSLGTPFLDYIHPDDRPLSQELFDALMQGRKDYCRREIRYLHQGGGSRSIEVFARLTVDAGGRIVGTSGTLTDITARRLSEEKLRLAADVFTHAREGIMITATDGTILEVNDAFQLITGFHRDEVMGGNPRILSSGRHKPVFYATLWQDLVQKGHWQGEVWNRRKNGEVYAELLTISAVRDAQGRTLNYVALFSDITTQKEYERQLEHIAHYDALTGLPNRLLLADRLHHAMAQTHRREMQLAVVYLDLDGFKAINDTYGHECGDQLLVTVASRMKQAIRESDTIARLGGDEFIAVLIDLPDSESSVPLLKRLLSAVAQPVRVGNQVLQVSASMGVTLYPQAEEVDADQLMRQADQAMYQAKLTGKNRYHVFDTEQDRHLKGRHETLEQIRQALQDGQFVLYYQPIVDLRTGAMVGAEALIRWQHPERGLLLPGVFLPVFEEHPFAIEFGEWVIETALSQLDVWQAQGLDIAVSVNVCARQLQQPDFVDRLAVLLAAYPRISAGHLKLEVLETSALEDIEQVSRVIAACHDIGVPFALDDFGTGYSSLTYLKQLPAAQIKIDQSFVRNMLDDPNDLAILQGVLGLAAAFHRQTIAEGVESERHADMLLQLGCELAQGFGIARPMPGRELPDWGRSWRLHSAWARCRRLARDDDFLPATIEHSA